jgi:hypothetical protein
VVAIGPCVGPIIGGCKYLPLDIGKANKFFSLDRGKGLAMELLVCHDSGTWSFEHAIIGY